jgi:hypothetical protein
VGRVDKVLVGVDAERGSVLMASPVTIVCISWERKFERLTFGL